MGLATAPLILIDTAYIALQPIVRPQLIELLKRVLLGLAFVLWGFTQLLRPGSVASILGDVVIAIFVIDLALIIKTHLQTDDWNTP
jgi:hypothetical protein